jgi:hypothetical protein
LCIRYRLYAPSASFPFVEHDENPIGLFDPAGLSRYNMFATRFHENRFTEVPFSETVKYPISP